ncbi:MAG TPA: condensation domain-containing protein, partial [Longimicrobiaceae bacterium]|nr:condensation domain-containing protein [Longimicrobiaceae bacterium]
MSKHPSDGLEASLVEDVYPLSPVQLGIVFHDLYSPGSGAYVGQYVFSLRGSVDPGVLRQAWQHVLDLHSVLRTAFVCSGMEQPVQVVFRRAILPWETLDWRDRSPDERREKLRLFLEAQSRQAFDLLRPPLMRLALIRTGDEDFELVWSYHHVLLDGWSLSLVLQDVLLSYDALLRRRRPTLPRRNPYRDYITWLQRQDLAEAEGYWRGVLGGFAGPTPLPVPGGPLAGEAVPGEVGLLLPEAATAALQALGKRRRLTLNTLVQGAWALLLARWAGEDDVVFGAVVTGRPLELAGMERMLGLFINPLPVRVQVEPGARVDEWLARLQAAQQVSRSYEFSPLAEVQRWSGAPGGRALFESIVAFQNHPVEEMAGAE